jgi:hypothetical protein
MAHVVSSFNMMWCIYNINKMKENKRNNIALNLRKSPLKRACDVLARALIVWLTRLSPYLLRIIFVVQLTVYLNTTQAETQLHWSYNGPTIILIYGEFCSFKFLKLDPSDNIKWNWIEVDFDKMLWRNFQSHSLTHNVMNGKWLFMTTWGIYENEKPHHMKLNYLKQHLFMTESCF